MINKNTKIITTTIMLIFNSGCSSDTLKPSNPKEGLVLISKNIQGGVSNGDSNLPTLSCDGRFVAFSSNATDLVPNDVSFSDIFLRDVELETTVQVSTDINGVKANGDSRFPKITSDGLNIAFISTAMNLTPGGSNGVRQVFVKNLQTGSVVIASVNSNGDVATVGVTNRFISISDNARYVVFASSSSNLVVGDTNGAVDVFVRDLQLNTTVRVSTSSTGLESNGDSSLGRSAISNDGRYVVMSSDATNLVPNDTNATTDVFLKDLQTGLISILSKNSLGVIGTSESYGPSISGNGRYVSYTSEASNLVSPRTSSNGYIHDLQTGLTLQTLIDPNYSLLTSSFGQTSFLSQDGRYVTYGDFAVYRQDLTNGNFQLISIKTDNSPSIQDNSAGELSCDGSFAVFFSRDPNLVENDTNGNNDVFLKRFN